MSETIPKDLRQLRACLSCSLIKVRAIKWDPRYFNKVTKAIPIFLQTFEQFENDGCENCEAFLALRHNRENVYDCTSSNFEGMVGMAKPDDSWVAKWQRISESERLLQYLPFTLA